MIVVVDLTGGRKAMYLPNLLNFLRKSNVSFVVVRVQDDLQWIDAQSVTGVILSGSPMRLTKSIRLERLSVALRCIATFNVPTLGICFGCQLINTMLGGTLIPFGRLICEPCVVDKKEVQFCCNDVIGKVGLGTVVKASTTVDDKVFPCHIENGRFMGYLFHPEAFTKSHFYLEMYLKKVLSISKQ